MSAFQVTENVYITIETEGRCFPSFQGGYIYVRVNNPTCEAVEVTMKLLERGAGSVVFGSGMAAITTTLLSFLKAGDHVVRIKRGLRENDHVRQRVRESV